METCGCPNNAQVRSSLAGNSRTVGGGRVYGRAWGMGRRRSSHSSRMPDEVEEQRGEMELRSSAGIREPG